jgi:hypothetical protein
VGKFRIEIEAAGGHGCERDQGDGKQFRGCQRMGCPDCEALEFFEVALRRYSNVSGRIIHWPDEPSEVRDEFVNGNPGGPPLALRIRHGSFAR